MRRLALLLCLPLVVLRPTLEAQDSPQPMPKILEAGIDAYHAGGPGEAIRVWLRGSPLEDTHDGMGQIAALIGAQKNYGPFETADVIEIRPLGPSTRIAYLSLDYEKGPLFAKFVLYRSGQSWIVTNFSFSLSDTAILPPE